MKIKQKASELLLQAKSAEVKVSTNGNLHIQVSYSEKQADIDIPGEYEYGGVGITALEITEESFVGNISIAKFVVDNVNVVYLVRDFKFTKEVKDSLSGADVLIVQDIDIKTLKDAVGSLDPYVAVIVSSSNKEKSENLIKAISKDYGVDNLEKEETISIASSDFDLEDDSQLVFKVLN